MDKPMTEDERTAAIARHLAEHDRKHAKRVKARDAAAQRKKARGLAAFVASLGNRETE